MTLALSGVTTGYGPTTVLNDVSLTVAQGTVVALLGANGAGKTTLLRVASGLMRPRQGEVWLDDQRVDGRPLHEIANSGVCLIPEGRAIFPSLTVRENLELQRRDTPPPDLLEEVYTAFPRLKERQSQTAGTMSGGEKQMLALARALIAEPRFILLDEISMGLSPQLIDEIFEALRMLARTRAGLLLVEQYVDRALGLADFVYVLNKGRVALCGEAGEFDEDALAAVYIGTGRNPR